MLKCIWADGIKCFAGEILRILAIVAMQNIKKLMNLIRCWVMKKVITLIISKIFFFIENIKVIPKSETNLIQPAKHKFQDKFYSQMGFQEISELNYCHMLHQLHIKYLTLTT